MKLIKLHLLVAAMIIVTSGCVGSGKKYKQQENIDNQEDNEEDPLIEEAI